MPTTTVVCAGTKADGSKCTRKVKLAQGASEPAYCTTHTGEESVENVEEESVENVAEAEAKRVAEMSTKDRLGRLDEVMGEVVRELKGLRAERERAEMERENRPFPGEFREGVGGEKEGGMRQWDGLEMEGGGTGLGGDRAFIGMYTPPLQPHDPRFLMEAGLWRRWVSRYPGWVGNATAWLHATYDGFSYDRSFVVTIIENLLDVPIQSGPMPVHLDKIDTLILLSADRLNLIGRQFVSNLWERLSLSRYEVGYELGSGTVRFDKCMIQAGKMSKGVSISAPVWRGGGGRGKGRGSGPASSSASPAPKGGGK